MISLSTNVTDLILQRTLQANTVSLNELIEKMTSGYKINHAKDNAAGNSIARSLSSKISSLSQVQANTENGISLLSYAQDSLEEIQKRLEKLRELANQAANGVYDVNSRNAMQAEADQIIEQISQIRENTEFDGQKLFYTPPPTYDTGINNDNEDELLGLSMSPKFGMGLASPLMNNDNNLNDENISASDEEDGTDSTSDAFSSDEPTGASPKSLRSAPRLLGASPTITGSVDFTSKQQKTVEIDGVTYTITNNNSSNN